MPRVTPTLAVCLLAVVAAIGAATFDWGGDRPAVSAYGGGAVVTIQDFTFSAVLATPGESITVNNIDVAPHTVTAAEGSSGDFDSGSIDGGGSGSFIAPDEPGTYDFFCTIHPSMLGSLTVTTP